MTDYPPTHPLWNRDEEWISWRAAEAFVIGKTPVKNSHVRIRTDLLAALVHVMGNEVARADRAEARVKELESAAQRVCEIEIIPGLPYVVVGDAFRDLKHLVDQKGPTP